jgi:hypothetical protein
VLICTVISMTTQYAIDRAPYEPDLGRTVAEDYRTLPTTDGGVLPATRRVFVAFAMLTLLATNQLLVVGAFTDRYFAWTISIRPNAAFLGAAYAAGFLLAVLALRKRRWRDVRVALVTVTVFTLLTLVPTVIHLHKFHLMDGGVIARLAAWVWLAIYLVVPIACLVVVIRQQLQPSGGEEVRRSMPRWLTSVLAAQGGTLFMVGVVLFVGGAKVHHFPDGAMSFWPWRLTPLSAQVIGAWLLAVSVATGLVILERNLNRLLVPAATYTAFGLFQLLVALRYWTQFTAGYQWGWAYIALFTSIAVTGAYGCWAATRSSDAAGELPFAGQNLTAEEFSIR